MFGAVGSNLKMAQIFMPHLWILHGVIVVIGQVRAICCRMAKRAQLLCRKVLRYGAFKCCDRLAGVGKCWAKNVASMLGWNVAIVWPRLYSSAYLNLLVIILIWTWNPWRSTAIVTSFDVRRIWLTRAKFYEYRYNDFILILACLNAFCEQELTIWQSGWICSMPIALT